ncbi:HAD family hydrolase [Atopobacter sp. AH10]|uniref:HAD family hydrolase n=1 Tax=Atopobacter sp. AH10 TaxID=2315861 RepID=UPI000EF23455|nr:HAD family hydrolase [Atopobacter sp. AH10]RLK64060.1 HAD family hydrolase [Atopobacter sp. AH10]
MTRSIAIGFDLDDTLYDRNEVYARVYESMNEDLPLEVSFEDFNEKYQELSIEEYQAFMRGEKSKEDYRRGRVIRTYAYFGQEATRDQADRFNQLYQEYKNMIVLRPAAKELLSRLKKEDHITLFVLTNGPSPDQELKCLALGVKDYVTSERVYVSDAIGHSKPDQAIFDFVANDLQMAGKPIYYIGDHYGNDIEASARANWSPVYFNCHQTDECHHYPVVNDFKELTKWMLKEGLLSH